MSVVIEFLKANPVEAMMALTALMTIGGLVVKLTPTKKDDEWWQKIITIIGKLTK